MKAPIALSIQLVHSKAVEFECQAKPFEYPAVPAFNSL
jgi:hypothetical protein